MLHRFVPSAALVAALLALAGCRKAAPEIADPWADSGFIRHIPAGSEGFLSLRRPLETWRSVGAAWQPLLDSPAARASWQRTPPGRLMQAYLEAPTTAPLLDALADAAQDEVFVALGSGTASQLAAVQQVKRLFDAARLRNLFTPLPPAGEAVEEDVPLTELPEDLATAAFTEVLVPLPPAMQGALEKFVRDAAIPPLLFGAKVAPDSALPRLLDAWVAALPEKIPRDKIDAGPHGQFTRVRLPVTMLVPTAVAVRARDILATNIGDPYAATYIIRDLLSKVTTLGFGNMHGYFVVSVGVDSGLPELAASPEKSLAAVPSMQHLEALLAGDTAALFHADPLVVSLLAAPPPVAEYLDAAMESALEFAPAGKIKPLRDAAAGLREQAAELFRPRVSAASGIVLRSGPTWRAELFGGSFAPRLALENSAPLVASGAGADFLWTENWVEGYAQRSLDFAGGLAAFSARWLDALGPVFLDEAQQARADGILRLVDQPAGQLEHAAGKLIESALDPHVVLAVSLDGTMPPPPLLPASAAQALLPRVAIGAGLRDREALARGWNELTASADAQSPRWPEPVTSAGADGRVSYEYPVPLGGPDLGITVSIADNRWILGTSRLFNEKLAGLPAPSDVTSTVQTVTFSTAPLAAFASAWSAALTVDPSLATFTAGLIPSDPQMLAALAQILETPRRFHYEAKWEQDTLHRVLELSPQP